MARSGKLLLILFAAAVVPLSAEDIHARWELSSPQAVVGQSLTLSIEINGADKFNPPNLSLDGVDINWQGGGPRNSTSVSMINGSFSKVETKAFVGSWSLKARRAGSFHLEPVAVTIGGKPVVLPALDWVVQEAATSADFFIKQEIRPEVTVIGLPVTYTLVWYIGQSAQNPEFSLPILDQVYLEPVADSFKAPGGDAIQLDYRGRNIYGVKGTADLGGKQYTTVTFKFQVKARKAGDYDLRATAVTFEGAASTRRVRDFFGNVVDQPEYTTLAARANPLVLHAKELPTQGKPAVFSGLIGKLRLSWSAPNASYQVGEPIRLTLRLDGVDNKGDLDLDYMVTTALQGGDFAISADGPAEGLDNGAQGRNYIFRARHDGKLVIPPLKLNYFDPESSGYRETETKALEIAILAGTGALAAGGLSLTAPQAASTQQTGLKADVNPIELTNGRRTPWWIWALPGLAIGVAGCIAGLWRHSRRRHLALERRAWRGLLGPIAAENGRAALEAGRERIVQLLEAGPLWRARLEKTGHWPKLEQEIRLWDRAFFADDRDSENWKARWDTLSKEMEGWK